MKAKDFTGRNHIYASPAYQIPKSHFLSLLPSWSVPYAQLMRIEKPHGYYTVLFPHLYGLLWASIAVQRFDMALSAPSTVSDFTDAVSDQISLSTLLQPAWWFVLGSVLLRGAACTWNDTIDAPYDRVVARCRHRPVARGALSSGRALSFMLVQSIFGLLALGQLPSPVTCAASALPLVILSGLYPWAKRITNYAQLMLGVALACGQIVGIAAAIGLTRGSDDYTKTARLGIISVWNGTPDGKRMWCVAACFGGANVLSAMIVDTVYAHQDLQDDIKAGLKSTAVRWRDRTKPMLTLMSIANIAVLTVGGLLMGMHGTFYGIAVCGTAVVFGWMTWNVNLQDSASCGNWFRTSILWSGLALLTGLCGEFRHLSGSS